MSADNVVPFPRRSKQQDWTTSRTFVPLQKSNARQEEADRLDAARAVIASPAYCREPRCMQVVSVEHPLGPGWLSRAVCGAHAGTENNRYALDGLGLFG